MSVAMRLLATVFLVPMTIALCACGFQEGVCIDKDECSTSQKNTCEKEGLRWAPYRNPKAFDKTQDTCSALGFTQPKRSGASYVKPVAR